MLAAVLALALHLPGGAAGDHALIVDIGKADNARVEALKHGAGVRWWLELGDRLLVAGDGARMLRATDADVVTTLDGVLPGQLALRARGCAEHATEAGTLLARGGRWELRRLGANETMPTFAPGEASEWREVQPNTVVAQRYRAEGKVEAPDPLVQPLVNAIDGARWFADVTTLAGWNRSSYGTTSLTQARDWIGDRFAALGLAVTKPEFTMPGPNGSGTITRTNVVGTWTGTAMPDEWVIVGGHYDSRNAQITSTTNAPGAEDNASGCAGVIEMARVLVAAQPRRTVIFMCYAGEEQGLHGSAAHVEQMQQGGNLDKVKAVAIMDMIGYSADATLNADFETYATWNPYLNAFAQAAATYAPTLNVTLSTHPFGSDHMPYLDAGKQAVLAIESDYDVYPHYHKSSDTPANMGTNALAMGTAILKTNVAVLAREAGASDRIFADGSEGL